LNLVTWLVGRCPTVSSISEVDLKPSRGWFPAGESLALYRSNIMSTNDNEHGEEGNMADTLHLVRTDPDNCRVYYKRGDTLYAFQRERREHFELYECTSTGEPMMTVPMQAIDRKPDDYPEFVRWVEQGNILRRLAGARRLPEGGSAPASDFETLFIRERARATEERTRAERLTEWAGNAQSTIDKLRQALEVIGVGDTEDATKVAEEALRDAGFWRKPGPGQVPQTPSPIR
jgi:hypothetical protein